MKRKCLAAVMAGVLVLASFAGCGADSGSGGSDAPETALSAQSSEEASGQVADASDMAEVIDVVEDGMIPVTGSQIRDGVYEVKVDSSSSMFKVEACSLAVEDGSMTAVMTMGGTGYLYVFPGTGEEAAKADPGEYIPFEETGSGAHTFTIPVEALDQGIACAAYSKRKQMWYDRTLVFRADSLPGDALKEGVYRTAADLQLTDGVYSAAVALEGGSGRASVTSPAEIRVQDGALTAVIEWSSPNYDYMVVNGEKYEPVNEAGNSVFEIPIPGFDHPVSVSADTTAMSTPHEIDYTLTFDSASVKAK